MAIATRGFGNGNMHGSIPAIIARGFVFSVASASIFSRTTGRKLESEPLAKIGPIREWLTKQDSKYLDGLIFGKKREEIADLITVPEEGISQLISIGELGGKIQELEGRIQTYIGEHHKMMPPEEVSWQSKGLARSMVHQILWEDEEVIAIAILLAEEIGHE